MLLVQVEEALGYTASVKIVVLERRVGTFVLGFDLFVWLGLLWLVLYKFLSLALGFVLYSLFIFVQYLFFQHLPH